MSTYVIGDIHGCYNILMLLLKKINFCRYQDKLIFVGDLVNRGYQSLEVLRFIKSLGDSARVVLGNHDLYLIYIIFNSLEYFFDSNHSMFSIFDSPDKYDLIHWLCLQNIMIIEDDNIIVHAGIPHIWSLSESKEYSLHIEYILQDAKLRHKLLNNLISENLVVWSKNLRGIDRYRCIINYFTRMRICDIYGKMDLNFKKNLQHIPHKFYAWFNIKNYNISERYTIIFGHWSALNGKTLHDKYIALDTGRVFGGRLTAYCITNKTLYSVKNTNLSSII